jgi:hypothetical protein
MENPEKPTNPPFGEEYTPENIDSTPGKTEQKDWEEKEEETWTEKPIPPAESVSQEPDPPIADSSKTAQETESEEIPPDQPIESSPSDSIVLTEKEKKPGKKVKKRLKAFKKASKSLEKNVVKEQKVKESLEDFEAKMDEIKHELDGDLGKKKIKKLKKKLKAIKKKLKSKKGILRKVKARIEHHRQSVETLKSKLPEKV